MSGPCAAGCLDVVFELESETGTVNAMRTVNSCCRPWTAAASFALVLLVASGCDDKATPPAAAPPPPEVKVVAVARETIPVIMPFAATVQAVQVVDIVPRVSGYIEERYFEEGTFVEKDAPLYLIDPRPYKARLDALKAQLKQDQAQVEFADAEAERYERLAKKGDVSKEARDKAISGRDEAVAKVAKDKADIEEGQLNLSFTRVNAPFAGRIEDTKTYPGSLVQQQRDVLTTLVQIDPVHVIFSMSRREGAVIQQLQKKGLAPPKVTDFKADLFLPDGSKYQHQGHLDFVSLQTDPKTDTITARAVFPNEGVAKRQTALIPGQYVPLQLIAGSQPDALLIPQAALVQSQIGSQVYVVGKDSKVEARTVEVDRAYDNRWVIRKGLEKDERVVVDGIQKVRSGVVVEASDMETKADADADAKSDTDAKPNTDAKSDAETKSDTKSGTDAKRKTVTDTSQS